MASRGEFNRAKYPPLVEGNTQQLVIKVLNDLRLNGFDIWLMGGWAEELQGLRPSGLHRDIDTVLLANGFTIFDAFLAESAWPEVAVKRLPHKRAFLCEGVLVEVCLACKSKGTRVTNIWGYEFRWPGSSFEKPVGILPMVSVAALQAYRGEHDVFLPKHE